MSLHRTYVTVAALLFTTSIGLEVWAQNPGFLGKDDDHSDFSSLYDPFCDLDTNWFEPIYCEDTDRQLNSGWFFGFSRQNLRVTRPRDVEVLTFDANQTGVADGEFLDPLPSIYQPADPGDLSGDTSWGNRFDFGWMSEEGTGLWFVVRKLDNPDERVDFDNIDANDDDGQRLDGSPWGPTFATVNGLRMWGFEANKTWRLAPTPRGKIVEPFVGLRYARIRDYADRTDVFHNYGRLNYPIIGPASTTEIRSIGFNYRQAIITTDNDLFGGQFGMRCRMRKGRWQITSDVRGLAFWNHQVKETKAENETQREDFVGTYDAGGDLTTVASLNGNVIDDFSQELTTDSNNTFVYGGELSLQLSFDITQGFAVNAGGDIIAFADGIGRGATGVDDSLVMTGLSFGFTFNR